MASIYHPGELAVQARAGQRDVAESVAKSVRSTIPVVAQKFLTSQPMAIIGALDADDRPWASMLTGKPGFMQIVDDETLYINAHPVIGDPLRERPAPDDEIGMIVIDFATRRRMRLNGKIESRSDGSVLVHVRQVYANCPKYIQARRWDWVADGLQVQTKSRRARSLTERQQRLIHEADTFFIASSHQEGGADASHRGGNPGFVQVVNESRLTWPDYSGNGMFQTLGNITAHPLAGLLFMDFESGSTLHLTGRARIVWDTDRIAPFPGAERLIEYDIEEVVELTNAIPLHWTFIDFSPFNPGG